jgi:hypothetical protein
MLIEKISGQPFENSLQKTSIKVGMKNSIKAGIGDFTTYIKHLQSRILILEIMF